MMMLPDRDGLAEELQHILDEYRDASTPTDVAQDRLWQRIDLGIAVPAAEASSALRIVGDAPGAGIAAVASVVGRSDADDNSGCDTDR